METHEILLLHACDEHNKIGPLNLVKVKKLDAKLVTKAHFYNLDIMEILLLRVVQIDKKGIFQT